MLPQHIVDDLAKCTRCKIFKKGFGEEVFFRLLQQEDDLSPRAIFSKHGNCFTSFQQLRITTMLMFFFLNFKYLSIIGCKQTIQFKNMPSPITALTKELFSRQIQHIDYRVNLLVNTPVIVKLYPQVLIDTSLLNSVMRLQMNMLDL